MLFKIKKIIIPISLILLFSFSLNGNVYAQEPEQIRNIKSQIFNIAKSLGSLHQQIHKNKGEVLGVTAFTSPSFNRNLTLGSKGEDVRDLQILLNQKGFTVANQGPGSPGNETDFFGTLTQKALASYQLVNQITPPSGYFGPITRSYISQNNIDGLILNLFIAVKKLYDLGGSLPQNIILAIQTLAQKFPHIYLEFEKYYSNSGSGSSGGGSSGNANNSENSGSQSDSGFVFNTSNNLFGSQQKVTLSVVLLGDGDGIVMSSFPQTGIICGGGFSDCQESFVKNTKITLTATPDADSNFAGWSGLCNSSISGTCIFTITENTQISASFNEVYSDQGEPESFMMINTFTPWWRSSNGIGELMDELNEGYDAGIRKFLMNGPYFTGTPGIDGYIPEDRWQEMEEELKLWLTQRPSVYVGPYMRISGPSPIGWPIQLYDKWDEIITPWLNLGVKMIGVDYSQHNPITESFFSNIKNQNPDLFLIGEAHGDFTAPYPTLAIPRWFWNFHIKNTGIIPTAQGERYVWITSHDVVVNGQSMPVWEAMGISKEAMIQQFRNKGYGIISPSVEEIINTNTENINTFNNLIHPVINNTDSYLNI